MDWWSIELRPQNTRLIGATYCRSQETTLQTFRLSLTIPNMWWIDGLDLQQLNAGK